MKNITFVGNLNAEFAKRKIYDYQTKTTSYLDRNKLKEDIKNVKKDFGKLKNIPASSEKSKFRLLLEGRKESTQIRVRGLRGNYKAKYNTKVDPLTQPISKRLESYKFNKEKNKEFAEVDNWLKNRNKEKVVSPSQTPSNNPSPKSSVPPSNPSPKVNSKSTTPLLQPKKLPLGKIGLGAVGLATVGAIGYGLLRKTRNDKGKKRGNYKR